jgi:[ribosomal protein S5]-alanine N-acetyltransferase
LAKDYWKQGYATEATSKVLEYGFINLGLEAISCTVIPNHTDSIKVAEKVGFSSYENTSSHGMEIRIYRMTSSDWAKKNNRP